MATLYSDPEWSSKNLETVVFEARRHVVKDKMPALFPDQLYKWREDLQKHSQEGYKTTFTDFWGKLIEYSLGDKVSVQVFPGSHLPRLVSNHSLSSSEPLWPKTLG
jgi:hypothetical protein